MNPTCEQYGGIVCAKCGKRCDVAHISDTTDPRINTICDLCRETTVVREARNLKTIVSNSQL